MHSLQRDAVVIVVFMTPPKWKILILRLSLGWAISTLAQDMHCFFWATSQTCGPEDTKCLYKQDNSRSLSLLITRNPEV